MNWKTPEEARQFPAGSTVLAMLLTPGQRPFYCVYHADDWDMDLLEHNIRSTHPENEVFFCLLDPPENSENKV